jgi:hypothetical protein
VAEMMTAMMAAEVEAPRPRAPNSPAVVSRTPLLDGRTDLISKQDATAASPIHQGPEETAGTVESGLLDSPVAWILDFIFGLFCATPPPPPHPPPPIHRHPEHVDVPCPRRRFPGFSSFSFAKPNDE